MEVKRVDVAIIGAGSAGLRARRVAAAAGATVVLIESGVGGTTCARVGCMPSKLLIAAADVAHDVAGAGRFGIRVPAGLRIDGRAVMERVRCERDRFVGFVLHDVEALPVEQRLHGRARFLAPTVLAVDDHTRVEARAVVIATGSQPSIPPSLHGVRDAVIVNDDIFELRDLPRSMAVVGTGVVGLEIGQAMHRLGVRTVFFSHSQHLGPTTDPEVQRTIAEVLGAELTLHQSTAITVQRDGEEFLFEWGDASGPRQERFDSVLAATGRWPDLADLDLQQTGLELNAWGAPRVDPLTMQCGDAPIFMAGDASNYRPVLHEASDEGEIAGANAAAYPDVRPHERRTRLEIAFTDPNMAIAGATWSELDRATTALGVISYDDQGRARVMGQNRGLIHLYARRSDGVLLGAEMFGPRVEHMAHLLAWAIQARLTVDQALAMPIYHPVVEEGLRTALRELAWVRAQQ